MAVVEKVLAHKAMTFERTVVKKLSVFNVNCSKTLKKHC